MIVNDHKGLLLALLETLVWNCQQLEVVSNNCLLKSRSSQNTAIFVKIIRCFVKRYFFALLVERKCRSTDAPICLFNIRLCSLHVSNDAFFFQPIYQILLFRTCFKVFIINSIGKIETFLSFRCF